MVGLPVGDAYTALTNMLNVGALFYRTSTSLVRQSAVLLQTLDIHLKDILYVAHSTDQQFTLILAFSH